VADKARRAAIWAANGRGGFRRQAQAAIPAKPLRELVMLRWCVWHVARV
jgi:hypothetical protein